MQPTLSTVDGAVLWFTGLSGAGKSTIATGLYRRLAGAGARVELLDGDAVRAFSPTGFSRADREAHIRRVGFLAGRLEHHGVTVLCALISPYAESRQWVREHCRNFLEVYVSTPLAECERRDVKGLYASARRGEIREFTGLDSPYEPPLNPDLAIDASLFTVEECVTQVFDAWARRMGLDPSS
jgi:adenylylsulfate kinase